MPYFGRIIQQEIATIERVRMMCGLKQASKHLDKRVCVRASYVPLENLILFFFLLLLWPWNLNKFLLRPGSLALLCFALLFRPMQAMPCLLYPSR